MDKIQVKPDTVLLSPHITEKAAISAEKENAYVFDVAPHATRKSVAASVKAAYKVTPLKVRLLAKPRKRVFFRGKHGVKSGGKKAYVFLKKGDKIDII